MRLKKTEHGMTRGSLVLVVIVVLLVILAVVHPHVTGHYLQRLWHDVVDIAKATWHFLKQIFWLEH